MSIRNCGFDPDRAARPQPVVTLPEIIADASARRNRILEQRQRERLQAARELYHAGLRRQVEGETLDDADFLRWMEAAGQLGKIQISINEDAREMRANLTPGTAATPA